MFSGTEIVDRDGKSSLLSLVKAFDSVLAVYEGFCNLKQVKRTSQFFYLPVGVGLNWIMSLLVDGNIEALIIW